MIKTIKIDGQKLKLLIAAKGMNQREASEAIGNGRSFISSACRYGTMSLKAALAIEAILGIKRSDFEIVEPEITEEPEPVKIAPILASDGIDFDKLYKTIYTAVYNATKDAWKEM